MAEIADQKVKIQFKRCIGMTMKRLPILLPLSILLIILPSQVALAGDYILPDTGITKCYDKKEITCPSPGEAFYGQDAQYLGAQLSYRDNGDGTVTDLNTGFIWQQSDDGVRRTWQAAIDYCNNLTLASDNNWKLPDVRELVTIIDFSRYNPSISPIFSVGKPIGGGWISYWTIDRYIEDSVYAWIVHFGRGGEVNYGRTSFDLYVRCLKN